MVEAFYTPKIERPIPGSYMNFRVVACHWRPDGQMELTLSHPLFTRELSFVVAADTTTITLEREWLEKMGVYAQLIRAEYGDHPTPEPLGM